MIFRLMRFPLYVLAVILASTGLYLLCALASALVPLGGRPQSAQAERAPVYLCADAVHADLVLPFREAANDLSRMFPEVVFGDGARRDYLSIGWGDLVFFTEVPNWDDVTSGHVASLFTGRNPVALRVVAVDEPTGIPGCRPLALDDAARRALTGYIGESLDNPTSAAVRVVSPEMAFYLAKGRYSPFHTCNQWIADGLGRAGLPHARFSPFTFGVTWPLSG